MNIRYFSVCVSLCVLLCASYGFAGGKHSTETPVEPPDNWVQKGDEFVCIVRDHVNHHESRMNSLDRIVISGFAENQAVTTKYRKVKLFNLAAGWAKVDRQSEYYNKLLYDPKAKEAGKASGFYSNGDVLLVRWDRHHEYAWRATYAYPLSDIPPEKGRKTHTNCDTRASETRVDLSTVTTRAECADDELCDEHRCAMSPLECGHFICGQCFPLENPAACISCLADRIGTGQKPT